MSTSPTPVRPPTRFRVPADLVLYAALVGRVPEIDPTLADPVVAATEARRENPWSPTVLSTYLKQIARQKAMRLNTPELAAWLKKQSTVARRRFGESRRRIAAVDRAA